MMMTLRGVAMVFPCPRSLDARAVARDSDAQDRAQLAQIADLVGRRRDRGRQGLAIPVDPRRVHTDLLRAEHVHVGPVANEERGLSRNAETSERDVEDVATRLAPSHLVGHDDGVEELHDTGAPEDVERGRRVVEVRDYREPVALGEPAEQRAVVRWEFSGAPERAPMGVDQRASEAFGQRGLVEPELAEEAGEAIERRHLAVVERAQALGLSPARAERLVARLQTDLGRLRLQD